MMTTTKSITEIINKYKDAEFIWGKLDCCIFAGLVLQEFHGVEFLGNVINSYSNAKGAAKTISKLGKGRVDNLPTAFLGTPKKDISEVKTGDMVSVVENGNTIIGVCNGVRAYFLQIGGGLTARNIKDCSYCWSIK